MLADSETPEPAPAPSATLGATRERERRRARRQGVVNQLALAFGLAIRDARQAAKLSQQQLAARVDVSRNQITRWEAGEHVPDVQALDRIVQALDRSLSVTLPSGSVLTVTHQGAPSQASQASQGAPSQASQASQGAPSQASQGAAVPPVR